MRSGTIQLWGLAVGFALFTLGTNTRVEAAIVFDNLGASYGQGGFEQYTGGQRVGASILNGDTAVRVDTVSLGGTLPSVDGAYLAIYSAIADGTFNDGTLGTLLYTSTNSAIYVENKPSDQFNPARGITTFELNGGFTLQANTTYWFVLASPTADPSVGPIQWAYTYSSAFATEVGAGFPTLGDKLTYFTGEVPDPDPSDPAHYFGQADGVQLIRISGTAVPEPSSIVLLGMAVLSLAVLKRTRA